MKNYCLICNGCTYSKNNYSFKCKNCNYFYSNLSSGFGQDVLGIESLRKENFKKIINAILVYNKNPKILEIGSGDGFFIEECVNLKISITGSEASKETIKNLKSKFKNDVNILNISLPMSIMTKTKTKFDFIVFNDVFEHLKDLDSVIQTTIRALKKDGIIIINSPTSDGIIFKISLFLMKIGFTKFYDRLWQKNMSSPHLSYFNKKNLNLLFSKHNLFEVKSGYLRSLGLNNFSRFKNLYDSSFKSFIFSIMCFFFALFQLFFPKDIMFVFFKKK